MGKDRPYHDGGGGLCSLGRWPHRRRIGHFEKGKLFVDVAKELLKESVGSNDKIMDLMFSLAAGKFEDPPLRKRWWKALGGG